MGKVEGGHFFLQQFFEKGEEDEGAALATLVLTQCTTSSSRWPTGQITHFSCSGHVGLWETDQPADGLDGLSGTAEIPVSNDKLTTPQVKLDQLEHLTVSLGYEAIGMTIVMGLPRTHRRTKQRTEQNDN